MKIKKDMYLDEDIVKEVKKLAIDRNTNISAIVNKLLIEYIKKGK